MLDGQVIGWPFGGHESVDDVDGQLDLRLHLVQVVLGVKIEIDTMVAESFHVVQAPLRRALRIRGTHIGRILTDHVRDGTFVLHHLLDAQVGGQGVEIVVRPCVRRDLMAFGDHALEQRRIRSGCIDGAFVRVVPRDEKRGVKAELFQRVEQLAGIVIGAIIVRQGDHVVFDAIHDVVVIRQFSQFGSGVIDGGPARRGFIRIAHTEQKLTIWIRAIIRTVSAISLSPRISLIPSFPPPQHPDKLTWAEQHCPVAHWALPFLGPHVPCPFAGFTVKLVVTWHPPYWDWHPAPQYGSLLPQNLDVLAERFS